MPQPSKIVAAAEQALSIKYNNLVYDLVNAGERVIVLSLGEAYFDIPLKPFDDLPFPDVYHYSHSRGILPLRQKIAEYYLREFDVPINAETELLVTAGSKAAIHFSLMSVLDPGDEVIIQEPTWVSYPEQVKLCYATPVMMPYNTSVADYERYITDRTKLIIVNNPHNPRGEVFHEKELRELIDLCRKHDIYLLSDEAYSDFVTDGTFISAGSLDPSKENVIVCNSISKNLGISGWRIGYVSSSSRLIDQILKVNQHLITCPATILQLYVAKHFDWLLETCKPQIHEVAWKRKRVQDILKNLGLETLPGASTFYFFVSIAPTKLSSDEFCTRLLLDSHVSCVPGIGYGASCDHFVRISFGTESLEDIEFGLMAVRRLIDATS